MHAARRRAPGLLGLGQESVQPHRHARDRARRPPRRRRQLGPGAHDVEGHARATPCGSLANARTTRSTRLCGTTRPRTTTRSGSRCLDSAALAPGSIPLWTTRTGRASPSCVAHLRDRRVGHGQRRDVRGRPRASAACSRNRPRSEIGRRIAPPELRLVDVVDDEHDGRVPARSRIGVNDGMPQSMSTTTSRRRRRRRAASSRAQHPEVEPVLPAATAHVDPVAGLARRLPRRRAPSRTRRSPPASTKRAARAPTRSARCRRRGGARGHAS